MRILLAHTVPASHRHDVAADVVPTGLVSLLARCEAAGHEVRLVNFSHVRPRERGRLVRDFDPELAGLSVFTYNRHSAYALARQIKGNGPETRVIVGGPHAAPLARILLEDRPEIDAVCLGEGEETLLAYAEALDGKRPLADVPGLAWRDEGGVHENPTPVPPVVLDDEPLLPRLPLRAVGVDAALQLRHFVTGRGCPGRCVFCQSPDLWPRPLRIEAAGRVVERMRRLKTELGLHFFSLRDDGFPAHKARLLEFARLVDEGKLHVLWDCQARGDALDDERLEAMRRSGCVQIQIGLESGSPRLLEFLGKEQDLERLVRVGQSMRRLGFYLSLYLITGIPGETDEDLEATRRILDAMRPQSVVTARLALYPGTELSRRRHGEGELEFWRADPEEESLYWRDDPWSVEAEKRLCRWGEELSRRSGYTVAEREEQLRAMPDAPVAHLALAEGLEEDERWDDAADVYEDMEARWPENAWAPFQLGILLGQAGLHDEAVAALGRAIALLPRNADFHQALGEVLQDAGRMEEGEAALTHALRLNPYLEF